MPAYMWTDASALYQVKTGGPGSERTESAFRYLAAIIDESSLRPSRVQSAAHGLLDAIRELRAAEIPAVAKRQPRGRRQAVIPGTNPPVAAAPGRKARIPTE